jgi:hypothetical protein
MTTSAEEEVKPTIYECPKGCGCWWRDNRDGTMSLFDSNQKSCKACEHLPLRELAPVRFADHLFIDARGDGKWLVCLETVYDSQEAARQSCRKWQSLQDRK